MHCGTLATQKILLSLAILFAISSCAKQQEHQPVLDVGQFQTYVDKFQTESVTNGNPITVTDLIIHFGDMSTSSERGYCEITEGETPVIVIDQTYWDSHDEGARQALIYHEMGHCVLYRKHRTQYDTNGIPISLMNAYTIDGTTFDNNEPAYWNELFTVSDHF